MAATKRNARFYVYELIGPDDSCMYVGKGSGSRLDVQRRIYGLSGRVIARFRSERDAYVSERSEIQARVPRLNAHPGGNGCRAQRARRQPWEIEIERVGSRRYVAQFLLARAAHLIEPSKLEQIRQVADGPRA